MQKFWDKFIRWMQGFIEFWVSFKGFFLFVICFWVAFVAFMAVETSREMEKDKQERLAVLNELGEERQQREQAQIEVARLRKELELSEQTHIQREAKLEKLRETVSILTNDLVRHWNYSDAIITAYSPLDDQNGINSEGDPAITSIGMKVGYGRFAVDPERIPYGSKILIVYADGTIETGVAADTGGALRDAPHMAIDVYRDTFDQAMSFGTQPATVIWYEPQTSNE